ncbi:MAG: hypothetical protein J7K98_04040 [Candidatus Aenigmarchaeota archaeon]|nr:hypothetical protein [Candidatus Aenigmarchaeota archaeon]
MKERKRWAVGTSLWLKQRKREFFSFLKRYPHLLIPGLVWYNNRLLEKTQIQLFSTHYIAYFFIYSPIWFIIFATELFTSDEKRKEKLDWKV